MLKLTEKELKSKRQWCYVWGEKCEVPLNCDNRCHRYDKENIDNAIKLLKEKDL